MKEIIRVIIILNSLILGARSMGDPPPLETPRITANFSLSVLAFMETFPHQTKGILVQKLNQEEDAPRTFPFYSPPPCNPEIPDELIELSKKLNTKTQQHFTEYLSETLPTDHFLMQVSESVLSNSLIETLNSSLAQFVLLITTDKTTNLNRFIKIIQRLDPRIRVGLSDRTARRIDATSINKLLAQPISSKLYYLALHHIEDETSQKIAACEYLKNLVGLTVERSYVTENGILAFGESPNLPSLKIFSVDLTALLRITQSDFTMRMAPFQYRLHRYEWVGRI
ncbi:MAG: hypothetical protein V4544_05740 [Pseudomonadota bacterium]